MSDSEKRSSGSLSQLIPIIALAVLLAPVCSGAEPLLLFHNERSTPATHQTPQHGTPGSVTVGLNENGDLMVRHNDLSLTLAYNPPGDIIDQQERIRVAQRQDCPSISGISLKVSLLF